MKVHAFVDEGLGHSSYLIDLGNGSAALIDPPRFPVEHEALADRLGLVIVWTIDTHSHADYVTGSPALAARRGATFVAPAASHLAPRHRPVTDGEVVDLGAGATITAIATPGHTPDHHAYLLREGGSTVGLFSGGSLMVGTVGRTDLAGHATAEPLAHEMFRSLRRFDEFADDVVLYPTHGAGSFCSAPGASQRTSTLGAERATNHLYRIADEGEFVETLLAGFGTFPSYFARLPELNRLGPRAYDVPPGLLGLAPADVEAAVAGGAVVVDVRSIAAFAEAHIPGSISNELRPVFGSWIGWLILPDQPIVFVADDEHALRDAVRQCLDVGHERFAGRLAGGLAAWRASGRATHAIDLVQPVGLHPTLIDVRQADEFRRAHVPNARNVELAAVSNAHLAGEPVSVMCGHGERAMTAASLLAARGVAVNVLDGGPDTWAAAMREALVSDR